MCPYVCVLEREREKETETETERERERGETKDCVREKWDRRRFFIKNSYFVVEQSRTYFLCQTVGCFINEKRSKKRKFCLSRFTIP